MRELARDLDRQKRRLDFLRRYLDLYRAYATAELHFVDDHTLALYRSLEPADQEVFAFDTAEFTWAYYLRDVHFPSVTEPIRKYDVIRKRRAASTGPTRRRIDGSPGSAESEGVLAVFDLDGTLMSSNIIETYLWMRLPELGTMERAREIGKLLRRMPSYVQAERRDRGGLLRAVYRRYEGRRPGRAGSAGRRGADGARARAGQRRRRTPGARAPRGGPPDPAADRRGPAAHPAAGAAVRRDRRRGPGRRRARARHGLPRLTPAGRRVPRGLAAAVRRSIGGYDLSRSYAYADSYSDLPMLRAVGLPDGDLAGRAAVARGPQGALAGRAVAHAGVGLPW